MTTKIYYYQFEGNAGPQSLQSPLNVDGVGLEPTRLVDQFDPKQIMYHKCPAWSHKAKREFTVYAPRDITLDIDYENGRIDSPNTPISTYVEPIRNWQNTGTFQLHIPKFYLWTRSKHIWVEQKDCGLTSANNNLTLIGGWWNLSEWSRLGAFAFDVVDKTKPVIIRRGDPLYRFAFYRENNLTESFEMVKSTPTLDQISMFEKRVNLKHLIPHLSQQLMFGKRPTKCPFMFPTQQ